MYRWIYETNAITGRKQLDKKHRENWRFFHDKHLLKVNPIR